MSTLSHAVKRPLDFQTLELREKGPLKRHCHKPAHSPPISLSFSASFPAAPHLSSITTPTPPTTPNPFNQSSGLHLHGLGIQIPADDQLAHTIPIEDEAMHDAEYEQLSQRLGMDVDMHCPSITMPSSISDTISNARVEDDNDKELYSSGSPNRGEKGREGTPDEGQNTPGRARFRMGYRSDCQKCRDRVPGHWAHY